jgi:2-phosphoglycerate kinase
VPVIENANVERTIDEVIELVMQAAERARQTA